MTALLLLGAPLAAGCTRTSDGSIEMAQPNFQAPKLPSWRRAPEPEPAITYYPAPPPPQAAPAPAQAPVVRARAPQRPRARSGFDAPHIGVRAPFKQSGTNKPVTCANKVVEGGRVKVVCQ